MRTDNGTSKEVSDMMIHQRMITMLLRWSYTGGNYRFTQIENYGVDLDHKKLFNINGKLNQQVEKIKQFDNSSFLLKSTVDILSASDELIINCNDRRATGQWRIG